MYVYGMFLIYGVLPADFQKLNFELVRKTNDYVTLPKWPQSTQPNPPVKTCARMSITSKNLAWTRWSTPTQEPNTNADVSFVWMNIRNSLWSLGEKITYICTWHWIPWPSSKHPADTTTRQLSQFDHIHNDIVLYIRWSCVHCKMWQDINIS